MTLSNVQSRVCISVPYSSSIRRYIYIKRRKESQQGGGLQRIVNTRALTIGRPPLNSQCRGIRAAERRSSSPCPSEHHCCHQAKRYFSCIFKSISSIPYLYSDTASKRILSFTKSEIREGAETSIHSRQILEEFLHFRLNNLK
jgi:hypothetical protein